MIARRRFITICASLAALPAFTHAQEGAAVPDLIWTGQALGARTSIRLEHPDAVAIAARVSAEIARLERIFSLYQTDSALARLNRDGHLDAPPFELLDCLGIAGAVHAASGGRFDPTVQRLWQAWAEAVVAGGVPDEVTLAEARALTGWEGVHLAPAEITLRPGMALTLNGIAQGYVADRVALLLSAEGLTNIFIDTGEFRALGGLPGGGGWPVTLESGPHITLTDRALATSAPLGTTFDQAGLLGHILDPRAGGPVVGPWRSVSVSAGTAALADALSTATCLCETKADADALIARFANVRLEALQAA